MIDLIVEEFGSRMRDFRVKKNMTQQELAEKCNLSLPFINLIENSNRKVSLENAVNILTALDVSLSDYFLPYSVEDIELSYLLELIQKSENRDKYISIFTEILEI